MNNGFIRIRELKEHFLFNWYLKTEDEPCLIDWISYAREFLHKNANFFGSYKLIGKKSRCSYIITKK